MSPPYSTRLPIIFVRNAPDLPDPPPPSKLIWLFSPPFCLDPLLGNTSANASGRRKELSGPHSSRLAFLLQPSLSSHRNPHEQSHRPIGPTQRAANRILLVACLVAEGHQEISTLRRKNKNVLPEDPSKWFRTRTRCPLCPPTHKFDPEPDNT